MSLLCQGKTAKTSIVFWLLNCEMSAWLCWVMHGMWTVCPHEHVCVREKDKCFLLNKGIHLKYFCKLCVTKNFTEGVWKCSESTVPSVRTVYIVVGKESDYKFIAKQKEKKFWHSKADRSWKVWMSVGSWQQDVIILSSEISNYCDISESKSSCGVVSKKLVIFSLFISAVL
jgi:hypothetical protein